MSPPVVGIEVEGEGPPPISTSVSISEEHNCLGLSHLDTSLCLSDDNLNLNLKATELRLGLPGSHPPTTHTHHHHHHHHHISLDEKPLFPLTTSSHTTPTATATAVSGTKRPYSHTSQHPKLNLPISNSLPQKPHTNAPAPKAQVVGWPPIRSFRHKTLATTSKDSEPLFVKVSMDGAPYLRKVDLTTYTTYQQLSSALENMFRCFTLGQCGTQKGCGRESLSETKLKDLLNGSEYVVTYEDKDGDWMLVGDVPWEMFIDTCKRLKIMKSCDAIGLAPRAMEKSRN